MDNVAPAGKFGTTEPKQINTLLLTIIIGFFSYKFKHTHSTIPLRFSYDLLYYLYARRGGKCLASVVMQRTLGPAVKDIDWKKLLGKHDNEAAKKPQCYSLPLIAACLLPKSLCSTCSTCSDGCLLFDTIRRSSLPLASLPTRSALSLLHYTSCVHSGGS